MNTTALFELTLDFAKRGLDQTVSLKSFADNFRDYTLLGLFATFVLFSTRSMESGWEFLLIITPCIALPFIAIALFFRTFFLVNSFLIEAISGKEEWWISRILSILLTTSYVYIIARGITHITAK